MPPYEWLERRLFEVLGGWVPTTPEPEVKLLLRRHSFQHAGHAELWAGLGGGGPRSAELEALVEAVAAPVGTAERLAGAYGVLLPALVASYRLSTPRPHEARVLRLVLAEEELAQAEARPLLERLGGSPAGEAHAAAVRALLADSGM